MAEAIRAATRPTVSSWKRAASRSIALRRITRVASGRPVYTCVGAAATAGPAASTSHSGRKHLSIQHSQHVADAALFGVGCRDASATCSSIGFAAMTTSRRPMSSTNRWPRTSWVRRRPVPPCGHRFTATCCTRGRLRSTTVARAASSSTTAPTTACCAQSMATRPAPVPALSCGRSSRRSILRR